MLLGEQPVLLRGAVFGTQETRALGQSLPVNLGPGAHYTGRVPLRLEFHICAYGQRTRLYLLLYSPIAPCSLRPSLQFTAKKIVQFIGCHRVLPLLVELLARLYLQRAKVVLIGIVAVDLVLAERCIAVAFPSAAQIHLVVDAGYAVAAAYHKAQSVVLTVARVGNLQVAQHGGEECAGRPKAVDAQGIVPAILRGPLSVVDETRGQGVELEVAHPVGAYHHGGVFGIEGIHHALQGGGAAV